MYCCLQILRIVWVTWLIGLLVSVSYSSAYAFVLPDTGITTCYDTSGTVIVCPANETDPYYGQDAHYGPGIMSFAAGSGANTGTINDLNTGLVWEQKTNADGTPDFGNFTDADNTYTWDDLHDGVTGKIKVLNDAGYLGYSDWRLPTAEELDYLVDLSIDEPGPMIDDLFAANTKAARYWTSDQDVDAETKAWAIDFSTSLDDVVDKVDFCHVRLVRGVAQ